jgi:uncharacterized protein (DUF39 family)
MSSLSTARKIAEELNGWIRDKKFFLSEPVKMFPQDSFVKSLIPREGGMQ